MALTKDMVAGALKSVADPESGQDIVTAGIVRALAVEGDTVRFVLEIDPAKAEIYEPVRARAEEAARGVNGVAKVSAVLTAHQAKSPPPDLKAAKQQARPAPSGPERLPGIDKVILVASGKGGVGKSTVSANFACALAAEGKRVALLDADIYGPSQPRMMGVSGAPESPDGTLITPKTAHGVTMMSIGLMMDEDKAAAWRGPMVMGALQQLLTKVQWGEQDYLIIDMPPGTGDVQMSLGQKTVVHGAVIVSTPQDIALIDARKGVDMFGKLNIKVLGVIENMSTHVCSNCGHEEHIFGHGGAAREAEKMGVPLIGEIPLHLSVREAGDEGRPVVVRDPDSPQAQAFRQAARALL
ncbi:P-loop NTPase [Aquicoccus sp. SCR17]|nr:P-loop NTPase [Carideicomes alvinocaridis]